ncbi:MAG: hypothetical protein SWX82_20765 [Cyanobacteriota bacterium]|nr:hypothetical protein [Cyanobacteriota bacterium]MDY7006283.1 hypothetical protein [Cyanobacteriota bacterium]
MQDSKPHRFFGASQNAKFDSTETNIFSIFSVEWSDRLYLYI